MVLRLLCVLIVLVPSSAFGQETTIITPVVPPPSTDWVELVAIGSAYVFAIVALLRQYAPKIDGRLVPLVVLPIAIGVALYQVGYSDLKLTAKHAGMLYLTAYGGAAGVRKLGAWVLEAWAAYQAGTTIPPPPSIGVETIPPESLKPAKPPKLPLVLLCLAVMTLAGCGAPAKLVAYAEAARDVAAVAEPCLVAQEEASLAKCADDAACKAAVYAAFKPIADALDLMKAAWCSVSATSEGCGK